MKDNTYSYSQYCRLNRLYQSFYKFTSDEEVKIKTHVDLINNCKYFILVKKYDLVKSINNKWERWWKDNFKADGEWRNLIFDGYKKLNYPILKHDIFNFYFVVKFCSVSFSLFSRANLLPKPFLAKFCSFSAKTDILHRKKCDKMTLMAKNGTQWHK